jgi:general secretion pathway protein L
VPVQAPAVLNLLPPERRAGPDMKRAAMKAMPAVLLVLLLAAVLLLPLWQAREVVIDLHDQERKLRKQAGEVIELREKLNRKLEGMEKIRDYWQEAVPPLEVLQVLTRLLPDDTYLQQLDIKGNELTMRGLSGQASALIGLLEESAVFEDPHFLSPVTQQRGKELFHLGASIRTPFPYEMVTASETKAAEKGQD